MKIFIKKVFNLKFLYWTYIILLGFVFVFLVPPMMKHDELTHFKRVVTLSTGQFFCKNSDSFLVPNKYINMADTLAIGHKFPTEQFSYNFVNFDNEKQEKFNGCGLFFFGYVPNTLGFMVGNIFFNQEPSISFYLSRFFGLIFFLCCLFLSLRNIKDSVMKTVLLVVSSIPMLLNQVSAIGYDGVLISLSILLFSWIIKIFEKKDGMSLWEKIVFLLLIIGVISVKPVAYFPFVLLYFVIPYKKINSSFKKYLLSSFCFFAFIGIYYLIYLRYGIFNSPKADIVSIESYNVHFQRLLIRRDPLFFLKVFFDSIKTNSLGYFNSMVGNYYFGTTLITRCLYGFIFGGLFVYVILNSDKCVFKFNKFSCFYLFGVIFGIFFLISLALYSEFSGLSSNTISGIQGRYFLPTLVYIFLFFYLLTQKIYFKKVLRFVFLLALVIVLLETVNTIYKGVIQREDFIREKQVADFSNKISATKAKDIEYKSILQNKNIIFEVKGDVFGLVLYHSNDNQLYKIPQKWFIKDGDCHKVLRSGYLQIDKLKESSIYEITFRKIKTKDKFLCLAIEPLEVFENENYLRIGFLDDEALVSPLLIPDYRIEIDDYGLSYNNNLNIGEVNKDTRFTQTFIAQKNYLLGVELFFATYMKKPNVSYNFILMDETCKNEIRRISLDVSSAVDLGYFDIYFDPIVDSMNKKYCFTLETKDKFNEKSNPVTIEMSKSGIYNDGNLVLNGETKDEDLMFRTLYMIEN